MFSNLADNKSVSIMCSVSDSYQSTLTIGLNVDTIVESTGIVLDKSELCTANR